MPHLFHKYPEFAILVAMSESFPSKSESAFYALPLTTRRATTMSSRPTFFLFDSDHPEDGEKGASTAPPPVDSSYKKKRLVRSSTMLPGVDLTQLSEGESKNDRRVLVIYTGGTIGMVKNDENGQSMVMGHGSRVTGHEYRQVTSWVMGHGLRITGHKPLVTGHGLQVTGHKPLVTGHESWIMCHGLRVMGHWSRVIGHEQRVTGHRSRAKRRPIEVLGV